MCIAWTSSNTCRGQGATSRYTSEEVSIAAVMLVWMSWQVFKDKGGDRKQKQDQVKVEKMTAAEQVRL